MSRAKNWIVLTLLGPQCAMTILFFYFSFQFLDSCFRAKCGLFPFFLFFLFFPIVLIFGQTVRW